MPPWNHEEDEGMRLPDLSALDVAAHETPENSVLSQEGVHGGGNNVAKKEGLVEFTDGSIGTDGEKPNGESGHCENTSHNVQC